MDVFLVIAFNADNFYPVAICDNIILAKNYAQMEYKERAKSHRIRVFKKTMNAPQLMEDKIVFEL
jgi:hypothetical protein